MGKQQETTETPTHDNLINYYSEKYYGGEHKEKIKEKLLSNGDLFNEALQDIHKTKYSTTSFDDFKNKYVSVYGNPFPEKKKSLSETGSEDSGTGSENQPFEPVDFSKEPKLENKFFSPENTGVDAGININDQARLEKERIGSEVADVEREKYLQSVDNKIGKLTSAGNDIAQSAVHGIGENLKAVGITAKDLDWFNEYDGMKAEELATYKAGDWLQETAKELFPTNPKFQDDFLAHTLPSATGSMLNFVGGGLATKGVTKLGMKGASSLAKRQAANRVGGMTVATMGATQLAATEYQNAMATNGGDHEKAMDVFYLSLPIGSLEAVPFTKFLKRLDKSSGGYVQKYLTNTSLDKITKTLNKVESTVAGKAGLGGLEEMTQEISSNALTNLVASETYDKTREIFEGAGEQGAAGFIIGAMLNGMGTSLRKKHSEATTPEEKADIQRAIDYVEVKEKELQLKEESTNKKIEESFKPGDVVELSPEKNTDGTKIDTGTDTGAKQEIVTPEQQVPLSEGDSSPIDQSITDLAVKIAQGETSFSPEELQLQANFPKEVEIALSKISSDTSGIKATEETAKIKMPALPAQEVVDDASQGEDVALPSDQPSVETEKKAEVKSTPLAKEQQELIDSVPEVEVGQKIKHGDYRIEKFDYGNGVPQIRISKKGDSNLVMVSPSTSTTKESLTHFINKESADLSTEDSVSGTGQPVDADRVPAVPAFNKKVSELTDALKNKKIDFSKVENSQEIEEEIEDIKLDANSLIEAVKNTKERLEKKKKLNKLQQKELDSANELLSGIPEDYEDYSIDTLELISKHGEALSEYDGYSKIAERLGKVYDDIQANEFAMVSSEGTGNLFEQGKEQTSETETKTPDVESPTGNDGGIGDPGVKQDEPKKKRRFPKQIEKAKDIEAEVKEGLTEKTKEYTPISNARTIEEANQYVKDANLDEALSSLKDKNASMPPRVRIALGEGIIKKANQGFKEATTQEEKEKFLAKAVEAAEFTSEYLTELGQGVQAAAIFGKLSWEGLVMHIQKKIKKARTERIERIAPDLEKKRETLNTINDEIVDQLLEDPKYKKIIEDKLKKVSNKVRKKGVDKAIDILEKLRIDTKGKAFDALYGLTAEAINTIITIVQKALKAGDSVVVAINKGINEHKKNNKGEFDEDLLREDLYDKLKSVESAIDPETAVKRGLKEMGTNIREIIKQHYTKADTAKRTLVDRLVRDADLDDSDAKELSAQINEAFTKLATKAKEKALKAETSIREKIQPKLSKSIDDKLIELSNLGALSQEDFNKIYAEKLGIKELSKEEVARLQELSDKIQEADAFAEETEGNFTKANIEKHIALQKEKQKALNEVSDIMSAKAPKDVWDTLSVILQGNLLSPISIVTNVYSNFNLMPLRYLSRLSAQGLDMLYSKATGKPRKIDVMAAAKGYNLGYLAGSKQGWQEFKEGSNVAEINKADIQRGLKPLKSFMEGIDPKKAQTINERISNLMEGTFGFPAEGMFRALTLGDRPFQIGAEYAKAFEIAKLKGLEGEALDKFIMFPDAESAELIKKAGEDATFKQSGGIGDFASRGIISGLKWISKQPVVGGPAKFFLKTQVPYVKTPINIIMETMDYALPQITFLKALYFGGYKKDRVKAFEYLGKAVVGTIIQGVAAELFKNGLLTGDPEKEKKERSLQHSAFPPNGFNISAYLRGGDYAPQKTDTWIGYDKMGVTGVIFSMVANAENHKVREGKTFTDRMDEVLYDTFSSMPNAASTALEMSFLQGANTFLDAVKSGEWDSWISNTMNAVTAVPIPNTISSFNRAGRTNLPELRDQDLYTRLGNVMKAKVFMAGDLPSKVDLWGNKIKQTPETTSPWLPQSVAPYFYHLFDVTKNREISADEISFEIYKLWRNSNSAEAIPAIPTQAISWEGEKFKLNAKLYEQYQIEVGKARALLVRSFIDTEEYRNLSDFEKIDYLNDLYEEGFEAGKEAFMERHGSEVLKSAQAK